MTLVYVITQFTTLLRSRASGNLPSEIKQDVFEQLVQPFLHLYQPKMHECTMNIVIAKTIEMFAGAQYQKLDQIHKHIAKEMNLTANHRGL